MFRSDEHREEHADFTYRASLKCYSLQDKEKKTDALLSLPDVVSITDLLHLRCKRR